jgi:hypothetical protein
MTYSGSLINSLISAVDETIPVCENEIQMGSDSRDRMKCGRRAVVTDMVDERQKCMKCFEESL